MRVDDTPLREWLIATAQRMTASGLNKGAAGNLSARCTNHGEKGFVVTPTGMHYDALAPEDLVFVRLDGTHRGSRKPSSEWRFHRDLYAARQDAGAVLHAHSPFAVALSCQRKDIPAFHYMIARFGGDTVRCSTYATYGTEALSTAALVAMEGRVACLMANHGMLVYGRDLTHAFDLGVELEELCGQYWRSVQLGPPVLLDESEMQTVLAKFASYGQQDG